MASTASDLLKVELQADGENDQTWGSKVSVVFERLEQAIADTTDVSLNALGGANYTLDDTQFSKGSGTTAESHRMMLDLTGTLDANEAVIVPARTKLYLVNNNTSGSFTVTVKTSAGTGIEVPQGQKMALWCDGTNVANVIDCFLDNSFTLADNSDTTKQLQFQLSGITTGTTRTLTVPDVDATLATTGANTFTARQVWAKGGDIASASPLVIDTDGNFFDVTGTTGFSAMTVPAGMLFMLQFDGALTITHGASIDLPGEANITTAAGDRLIGFAEAADTVQVLAYFRAAESIDRITQGTHTIVVPAAAMRPTVSNGCAALTDVETTAGRPDLQVLDFDATSDEHAQFQIPFPKSWDEGTITFRVFWTSTATDTDGVTWALQGVAAADGDTADVAYGTAVTVDDANQSTAEDVYVSPTSSAVTIAGSPGADEICFFRVFRDVSDANDTAAEDARLIAVQIFLTIDAADDS